MLKQRLLLVLLVLGVSLPLLAQTSGRSVTLHYGLISPAIALIAGILILIMPRLLNYVVAIYLILVGLIGIFGR